MKQKIVLIIILFTALIPYTHGQSIGRIDEGILKGIVNIDGKGTGFLVGRQLPGDKSKAKIFLVTNKHMIGQWSLVDSLIPSPSIVAYLYTKDKLTPVTPVKINILDKSKNFLPTVKVHQNPKIDIVVIDITEQVVLAKNLDIKIFDINYLVPIDSIKNTTFTGIGDQVYAIGYPAGITSTKTNKPIIKSGYISSDLSGDLELNINCLDRKNKLVRTSIEGKYFLVDGLIIGGNSGGPIVHAKQIKYKVENGELSYTPEIPNLIFGIVSSGLDGTGISVIYSSDHIIELLNEFKLE